LAYPKVAKNKCVFEFGKKSAIAIELTTPNINKQKRELTLILNTNMG